MKLIFITIIIFDQKFFIPLHGYESLVIANFLPAFFVMLSGQLWGKRKLGRLKINKLHCTNVHLCLLILNKFD